ncbi:MAG: hypothetical protein WBL50_27445 [Candidatus Acidiferrum sp.]
MRGGAAESYRQLWLAFLKKGYVGGSHSANDQWLKQIVSEMDSEGKIKPKRGRASLPKAQIASILRRYDELLPTCILLHYAVESALSSIKEKKKGKNPNHTEIRKAVFKGTRNSIHGTPFVNHIFGGGAFAEVSCGLKHAHLHDPKSWGPHNLVVSLLTFERNLACETIEKMLRRHQVAVAASSLARI